jgi:hypothetical protein
MTIDLHNGGCQEVFKKDVLVVGKSVEKHTITFELDVRCTDYGANSYMLNNNNKLFVNLA